jgi:DNA-binding transcriptional LysR family regulator
MVERSDSLQTRSLAPVTRNGSAGARVIAWDDLRHFLAVARHGSLAAAGKRTRVDPTTVGRRVSALEEGLGVALFVRRRDRWTLTPAGQRVLPIAERAEGTAAEVLRAIAADQERPAGRVRVTMLEEIAERIVAPALPRVLERLPEIRIDLLCTPRRLDLARGQADLALRLGRPEEPELITRRVAAVQERAWASQAWLDRHGLDADALDHHDERAVVLLLTGERERWTEGQGRVKVALRASSPAVTYAAIAAGVGVGLIPTPFATDPRLVPLPGLPVGKEHTLWLTALPTALQVPRVRAVADALVSVLGCSP